MSMLLADTTNKLIESGVLNEETLVPVTAIFMGCSIAIIAIIAGAMRRSSQTKSREKSRSEIAAYIAEGSMTADEGERLLNAGPSDKENA